MADKEAHYAQTGGGATLQVEAKIEEADPVKDETTPFTVIVRNTGAVAMLPIQVGCDLTGASDAGVTLFGPSAAQPANIAGAGSPLGPGESRTRHWVALNDGSGAGDGPPFTIQITVVDQFNTAGVVHAFACP